MTIDLEAIKARCKVASQRLQAVPLIHLRDILFVEDIPVLVAEVERLRDALDSISFDEQDEAKSSALLDEWIEQMARCIRRFMPNNLSISIPKYVTIVETVAALFEHYKAEVERLQAMIGERRYYTAKTTEAIATERDELKAEVKRLREGLRAATTWRGYYNIAHFPVRDTEEEDKPSLSNRGTEVERLRERLRAIAAWDPRRDPYTPMWMAKSFLQNEYFTDSETDPPVARDTINTTREHHREGEGKGG